MRNHTLKVELQMENEAQAGSSLDAKVVLRNVSAAPVLVNGRLLVNSQLFPGELFFAIESENGRKFDLQVLLRTRPLTQQDFVVLDAGRSIEKTVSLKNDYGVDEPGIYTLSVTYRNEQEWSRDGQSAWVGEVSSEPVHLQLR